MKLTNPNERPEDMTGWKFWLSEIAAGIAMICMVVLLVALLAVLSEIR